MSKWTLGLIVGSIATTWLADEPIEVRAQLAPGPCYVGQAIDLWVSAIAGSERPKIVAPRVPDAQVIVAGTEFAPLTTSAIGNLVAERNRYRYRFRIVPRRAGNLVVPPVVVRLGNRTGASAPLRRTVRDVPVVGRPPEFLGGVGPFALQAEARPGTVRSGQELEYRITVTGPGALGISARPSLERLARLPLGFRINPLPEESVGEPPSRVFRYGLRPLKAGEATLPPVSIAAFDPKAERYVAKVTPSVPVRVVEVPRFDPATLNYGPPPVATQFRPDRLIAWVAGLSAGALMLSAAALLGARRLRARRGIDWRRRRLLERLARELDPDLAPSLAARRITEGLAAYLALLASRPKGALTPSEAERGVSTVTGSTDLGERSGRLIALCDRAQYAGSLGPASTELVGEARTLLDDLIQWKGRGEGDEIANSENTERGSRGRPT